MGKKSSADKETILLESFEVLKENLENNRSKLGDIVVKIGVKNLDLAVEMWSYLISHPKANLKEEGHFFTWHIMSGLEKKVGIEKTIEVLKENLDIFEACYAKSDSVNHYGVFDMLKAGEYGMADEAFKLIKSNRYKEETFASYLEDICEAFVDEFSEINDFDEEWDDKEEHDQKVAIAGEASSLLLKWVKTISDKQQKARLNVTLIDYV